MKRRGVEKALDTCKIQGDGVFNEQCWKLIEMLSKKERDEFSELKRLAGKSCTPREGEGISLAAIKTDRRGGKDAKERRKKTIESLHPIVSKADTSDGHIRGEDSFWTTRGRLIQARNTTSSLKYSSRIQKHPPLGVWQIKKTLSWKKKRMSGPKLGEEKRKVNFQRFVFNF